MTAPEEAGCVWDVTQPKYVEPDGLDADQVGVWARQKYCLLRGYADIFARSMRKAWPNLVYIDLFAGSGYAQVRGESRIMAGSPLLALGAESPFTSHIICEEDTRKLGDLQHRVQRDYPSADVQFVRGDCNAHVEDIIAKIPKHSRQRGVLSFCFVDPYAFSNLAFSTIEALAADGRKIDFLVLIPSGMDANRNLDRLYSRQEDQRIERFCGVRPEWKERWRSATGTADLFVTDLFGESMGRLGYIYEGSHRARLISSEKNLPLYRLMLFSREPLGNRFWVQVQKYAPEQTQFGFMADCGKDDN